MKKIFNTFIITFIIIIGIMLYSKYVGTKGVNVKETRIVSESIPSSFSGVKIMQFSDLLFGSTVDIDDVNNLVNTINEYKPDIVIFSGDLISENYKLKNSIKDKLIDSLSNIDSTIGKYFVIGSLDNDISNEILNNSGFILLDNSFDLIYYKGLNPICLVGISSYNKSLDKYEGINCEGNYTISVSHEPDIYNKIIENFSTDIFLSGNSLYGEINIPLYGPLTKFKGSTKYYNYEYKLDNTTIYISGGIGTKKYYKRLFNKPSINLFRLKSTHE